MKSQTQHPTQTEPPRSFLAGPRDALRGRSGKAIVIAVQLAVMLGVALIVGNVLFNWLMYGTWRIFGR